MHFIYTTDLTQLLTRNVP